jgi:hypothetical protein
MCTVTTYSLVMLKGQILKISFYQIHFWFFLKKSKYEKISTPSFFPSIAVWVRVRLRPSCPTHSSLRCLASSSSRRRRPRSASCRHPLWATLRRSKLRKRHDAALHHSRGCLRERRRWYTTDEWSRATPTPVAAVQIVSTICYVFCSSCINRFSPTSVAAKLVRSGEEDDDHGWDCCSGSPGPSSHGQIERGRRDERGCKTWRDEDERNERLSQLEKGGNVYCGLRNRSGAKDKSALAITNSTMFMSLGLV